MNKLNTNQKKSKQPKIQQNKTTLVQLPLTALGQETTWAYSTTPPSPHGAPDQAPSYLHTAVTLRFVHST